MSRSLIPRLGAVLILTVAPTSAATAQVVGGRITSAADASALAEAVVTLIATDGTVAGFVRADSIGAFQLQAREAGSYRLYVVHPGFTHYVSPAWIDLEAADDVRLEIALRPSEEPQALPAVLVTAERESIRNRRVHGLDLRAVDGEIITRSEVAAQAPFAATAYDVVRSKRIGALRQRGDLCLVTNAGGPRRGANSVIGLVGGSEALYRTDQSIFGDGARTNRCIAVLVDEVPWARPGESEDAFYGVLGHVKPEDIDWMFVRRSGGGAPTALYIYTKDFTRYAQR